jgi:hypothetical protein
VPRGRLLRSCTPVTQRAAVGPRRPRPMLASPA